MLPFLEDLKLAGVPVCRKANMKTILVVDDESNIRTFINANLALRGFQVVEAGSAEEALEKMQTITPDALILDVLMPGMTGWELAKVMAENELLRGIPIILLTASISDANSVGSVTNVVERLVKPLGSGDLVAAVRRLVL
jgi:two-component system NtrC family sensor kinase